MNTELILDLKCKQGNKYSIKFNGKKLSVSESDLIKLIKLVPANKRNCKISNNAISESWLWKIN
jgi:hypothetical protein